MTSRTSSNLLLDVLDVICYLFFVFVYKIIMRKTIILKVKCKTNGDQCIHNDYLFT